VQRSTELRELAGDCGKIAPILGSASSVDSPRWLQSPEADVVRDVRASSRQNRLDVVHCNRCQRSAWHRCAAELCTVAGFSIRARADVPSRMPSARCLSAAGPAWVPGKWLDQKQRQRCGRIHQAAGGGEPRGKQPREQKPSHPARALGGRDVGPIMTTRPIPQSGPLQRQAAFQQLLVGFVVALWVIAGACVGGVVCIAVWFFSQMPPVPEPGEVRVPVAAHVYAGILIVGILLGLVGCFVLGPRLDRKS